MNPTAEIADGPTHRIGTRTAGWTTGIVIVAAGANLLLPLLPGLPPWLRNYPSEWVLPFNRWISAFANWLLRDFHIGPLFFKDISRAFAEVLQAPILFLQQILAKGLEVRSAEAISLPPISWLGVTIFATSLALSLKDTRLAVLTAGTLFYCAAMGLWQSAMLTLSLVLVAVVLGVVIGVLLGIASYRSQGIARLLEPILDFMQTVPVFGYLVPSILLFGYTPAAALALTLVYSVPPMVRITYSGLRQANPETVELGRMTGCSPTQLLWRVMLPSERPRLMLGVNQVIMLTLNMVIITSLIGAGGLGYDVWQAVKSLHIGRGVEAGVAITLLAIALDRLSQRFASQRPDHTMRTKSFLQRNQTIVAGAAIAILLTVLGHWFPPLAKYPAWATLSSGRFWDLLVDWINVNAYGAISFVRDSLFLYVLRPAKEFMSSLSWLAVVALMAALGLRLSGYRLAILCGLLTLFIAVAGQWEKAMLSVYLVGIAVLFSMAVGVPLGFLVLRNERLYRITEVALDALQTLPSFVYLIPVVMLLGVGDFSALVAIVLYAIAPAVRYTAAAIQQVPSAVIEAAKAFGATPRQIRRRIIVPLALPDIVLGLNQTLMLAISMLVITALVGTRDLGQETLIALASADPGRGLVAGICVAFIAIVADRMLRAWIDRRKEGMGLSVS
jgi:glycine betaine/proline transport system permease protein